nr:hypothetical protein [Tanacetum cinerariifolium]
MAHTPSCCFEHGLYVYSNANGYGNTTKLSYVKGYKNEDQSHKHELTDEAIGINIVLPVGNNKCEVVSRPEVYSAMQRHKCQKRKRTYSTSRYQVSANANNYGNATKLSAVKGYRNEDQLHVQEPTDEAVRINVGFIGPKPNQPDNQNQPTKAVRKWQLYNCKTVV